MLELDFTQRRGWDRFIREPVPIPTSAPDTSRWAARPEPVPLTPEEFRRAVEEEKAEIARLGYVQTPKGRFRIGGVT